MATNITPSTCTFVTADMKGETGEIFPSATWQKMSDNGGFCVHLPRMLCAQQDTLTDSTGTWRYEEHYVYMVAGTQDVYAGFQFTTSADGYYSTTLNGTDIPGAVGTTASSAWKLGSYVDFVAGTTGWQSLIFGVKSWHGDNTINYGMAYTRYSGV